MNNPNIDCAIIKTLYKNGFLQLINNSSTPVIINNNDRENIFWNSFRDAYWNANKRGIHGRIRILSIIAEKFTYVELQGQLQVSIILIHIDFEYLTYYNFLKQISPNTINLARKHARLHGSGAPAINIPKRVVHRLSNIQEAEFLSFFQDKNNVVQSSYQVDAKSKIPICYMKDQKSALWSKFEETYPNGMRKTAFMT